VKYRNLSAREIRAVTVNVGERTNMQAAKCLWNDTLRKTEIGGIRSTSRREKITILGRSPESKRPLGRTSSKWEDNFQEEF